MLKSASATRCRCGCSVFCTEAGEALEGGENGEITVSWERRRATDNLTDVYAVTPVYDVFGEEFEGEPVQASVTYAPLGMVGVIR